jgi:hypothetical protein
MKAGRRGGREALGAAYPQEGQDISAGGPPPASVQWCPGVRSTKLKQRVDVKCRYDMGRYKID